MAVMESRGELWEEVSWNKGKERTERLWIAVGSTRGWIYRSIAYGFSGGVSVAMTFVPEANEMTVTPGDVVAFVSEKTISAAQAASIEDGWQRLGLEGVRAIVLDEGLRLQVIRKGKP